MKKIYKRLIPQDILSNKSILLRRIERTFGDKNQAQELVLKRMKRQLITTTESSEEELASRWVSTECNVVGKLEKIFNTTIKDKGHKLLETDVSRLAQDFLIGKVLQIFYSIPSYSVLISCYSI